ncbi:PKD domain-containing protein [Pedobacter puniceum]|jgi:PKD repeat protein|uniref:PKD domain-containing protein n=1 Tax=Pedobacter puniceum TaxID=2666136 RepID=A0A7K0FP81_9SPHI|nr:PKD domain-containing protein [Pedobacter puniceum]MRX47693.1 PKD domain-containing protein [Pedobacter puniceum]
MKKNILITLSAVLTTFFWTACKESDNILEGTPSEASFTAAITAVPDTLPFQQKVTFTNNSKDAFIYKWDFGDGSNPSAEANPVHIYKSSNTFTVKLTSVGKAGSSESTRVITVQDACSNETFRKLTSCGVQNWTWSSSADAIRVLSADASQVFFAGPAAGCQVDDRFTFQSDGTFRYDARGETFSVQAGYSCQPAIANANSFKMVARAGSVPKIILGPAATGGRAFLGTTDQVVGNAYEIRSITDETMVLRGTLTDGNLIEFKFQLPSDLDNVKLVLTGGSTRSWKLDVNKIPGPITVGPNDGDPTGYFGGGPLAPCQIDDVYTFGQNNTIVYNAGAETFVAGNPGSCQAPRNYSTTYTFTNVPGGAGIAQINLPINAQYFIGITDRPNENVYRIIEINDNRMVLRAGNGNSGVVFDLFFVRAN